MFDHGWLIGLVALIATLAVAGSILALSAWRMARNEEKTTREPKIEVLAGIGGGLVTGIAVGLSALFLEQSIENAQLYATWKSNVEVADSIPGFDPDGRDIEGINFSGKELRDADFKDNEKLKGAQFRDTDLTGADFRNANLTGANLIGANLQEADLTGATLDGAMLQSANLAGAIINHPGTSFNGAMVNAYTCWPEDVDVRKVEGVVAVKAYSSYRDGKTVTVAEEGDDGFIGGERYEGGENPKQCTMWKEGKRIR
ncbi:pentapeptide repeat-containing protein [Streptomyces sp. NPDC018833]|uniref:pentapeptide repeat-containing protein n=1 Tax=Streptomyces sp. NPDC018833 TaxID=3365053 RepID=UPI003787B0A3